MPQGIKLLVSGDFACFTRPEMKVERVSYDVITPSAARGILDPFPTNGTSAHGMPFPGGTTTPVTS